MALTDNLSAYWELEEASGTRVDAHSTFDLTDNNTVGQATGKVGNAALLVRANSEYLSVADDAALSGSGNTTNLTVAAWVYMESDPAANMWPLAKWGAAGNAGYGFRFLDSTSRLQFVLSPYGTASVSESADNLGAPSLATWYFLVGWRDDVANTINIQVNDGTADSAAEGSGIFNNTADFRIGSFDGAISFWDGRVDQVGVWQRVLTAAERTELYNDGNGLSYSALSGGGVGGQPAKFGRRTYVMD